MNIKTALKNGCLVLLVSCTLVGCETMFEIKEGAAAYTADEDAKRKDDPSAYAQCNAAYSACSSYGTNSYQCTSRRDALISDDIYCAKVGAINGRRGR